MRDDRRAKRRDDRIDAVLDRIGRFLARAEARLAEAERLQERIAEVMARHEAALGVPSVRDGASTVH